MAGELFKHLAKIDINHVAYKGAAQAAPDLVSGEIQLMFSSIPDMLGFIQSDKLRAIGISTKNRSPCCRTSFLSPSRDFRIST